MRKCRKAFWLNEHAGSNPIPAGGTKGFSCRERVLVYELYEALFSAKSKQSLLQILLKIFMYPLIKKNLSLNIIHVLDGGDI
jgi:hypothetical protein